MSEPSDRCFEFDCCECSRHIVTFIGQLPEPRLCATCLHMPGWNTVPELRDIIDPTYAEEVGR